MHALTILKSYLSFFLSLLMIYGASLIHQSNDKIDVTISAQDVEKNFNIPFLKAVSLGHRSFLADLFWIQTMIESDIEHYKKKNLGSWMYLRFKTIIELNPNFLEAYRWGSQYLMIVKDDLIGSERILDMGLRKYPDDYELNYYKGFLYMSEHKDIPRSLPYFEKIIFYPEAPAFLAAMVAKLRYKEHLDKEKYLYFLKELHSKSQNRARIRDYLEGRIRELERSLKK